MSGRRGALRLLVTEARQPGTVTAMREEECAMCDTPIAGAACLVEATRRHGRRTWGTRELICEPCYRKGWLDPETGLSRSADLRSRRGFEWHQLVGRGGEVPPAPCASCGRAVIRNADPLLQRVTCSHSCSTSLTRTRNGGKGSGQPCDTCGTPVTQGRADSRYCSSACRQKAYRKRVSHA